METVLLEELSSLDLENLLIPIQPVDDKIKFKEILMLLSISHLFNTELCH